MNVVKVDHNPGGHGTGRPIIYQPHINTAYVGVPGGYHIALQDQMNRLGAEERDDCEHWRMGPDGLLDFYDFSGLTPKSSPAQRQEAVQALQAQGVHKYVKGDTSWYFGALSTPPTPDTPDEYHKAVTVNGQHHVFPGDIAHLDRVKEMGLTPHDVTDYWGWNPYNDKWENFNRFQQDYKDIWNEMHPYDEPGEQAEQGWNMPTLGKLAWETDRGMRKRLVNENLDTFTKMYTNDLDKAYANGVAPRGDWPATMNRVTRQYGGPGWSDADDSQFHQNYQQQKQQQYVTNPDTMAHEHENWTNWYAQHFPQHFDPEGTAIHAEPWTLSKTAMYPESNEDDTASILHLLSPEPTPDVYQKGIETPTGERYFWTPGEEGWPHHPEVIQALGLNGHGIKFLEHEQDGPVETVYDAGQWSDMDHWG